MINGYTFYKRSNVRAGGSRYCCSNTWSKNCKAYAHVDANNFITLASLDHNHEPSKYVKTKDGAYFKL